ncbi:hypothetical protein BA195_06660 [Tenacibaculum soleae]|uniref:Uncharacterized protein n=1 Tax=Tenacibaculum soleae TaxID=447689 RepID=A0A1B9Y3J3_9FLAO|nr:hypothetical protein [Tenacibaculum soleae]OCK44352.1 hypothetical protein BA195_06660 [Tenacibaculum soleae]
MLCNTKNRAYKLKARFVSLGFKRLNAFFYICKSLKVDVAGMSLIEFWNIQKADAETLLKIENVITILKNE